MAQFDTEDRRLQAVQSAVDSLEFMVVLSYPSMIREHSGRTGPFRVVGDQCTCITIRAEVLSWVEAVAGDVCERRNRKALVLRAMGLRRIPDDLEPVLPCDRQDRIHIGRLAVQVHRDYRLRSRRDLLLELLHVHQVGVGINVDEHDPRTRHLDGLRRRDEAVRNRDHFVARADAECPQRDVQRVGAVGDTNALRTPQ